MGTSDGDSKIERGTPGFPRCWNIGRRRVSCDLPDPDGALLTMTQMLADQLADFALSTRFEDLPGEVVVEARRRLLDAFACAAGALDERCPHDRAEGGSGGLPPSRALSLFGGGPILARLGGVLQWRPYPLPRLQ